MDEPVAQLKRPYASGFQDHWGQGERSRTLGLRSKAFDRFRDCQPLSDLLRCFLR